MGSFWSPSTCFWRRIPTRNIACPFPPQKLPETLSLSSTLCFTEASTSTFHHYYTYWKESKLVLYLFISWSNISLSSRCELWGCFMWIQLGEIILSWFFNLNWHFPLSSCYLNVSIGMRNNIYILLQHLLFLDILDFFLLSTSLF